MSMSYGPGRYDRNYEELGLDYPLAHVRWTENRNLQAFLALAASGAIDPLRLDARIVAFDDALATYEELAAGRQTSLVAVFRYPEVAARAPARARARRRRDRARAGEVSVGVRRRRQLRARRPAAGGDVARARVRPACLVTATGASARRSRGALRLRALRDRPRAGIRRRRRSGLHRDDPRRARGAGGARAARGQGGVAREAARARRRAARRAARRGARDAAGSSRSATTGASRATRAGCASSSRAAASPLAIHYAIAAGPPPAGTWYADPQVGGGRIVGEVCHFVDLCAHLAGAPPVSVHARALGRDPATDDSLVASLAFARRLRRHARSTWRARAARCPRSASSSRRAARRCTARTSAARSARASAARAGWRRTRASRRPWPR